MYLLCTRKQLNGSRLVCEQEIHNKGTSWRYTHTLPTTTFHHLTKSSKWEIVCTCLCNIMWQLLFLLQFEFPHFQCFFRVLWKQLTEKVGLPEKRVCLHWTIKLERIECWEAIRSLVTCNYQQDRSSIIEHWNAIEQVRFICTIFVCSDSFWLLFWMYKKTTLLHYFSWANKW